MRAAAEVLLERKDEVAAAATDALYEAVPQLLDRFGDAGRRTCRDDLRYTIEHLVPAVALNEPNLFERYVVWLRELLEARGVSSRDVGDSLVAIERVLGEYLDERAAAHAIDILRAGRKALGADE